MVETDGKPLFTKPISWKVQALNSNIYRYLLLKPLWNTKISENSM